MNSPSAPPAGIPVPRPTENPAPRPAEIPAPSLIPIQGWHCTHTFYRFNRGAWQALSPGARRDSLDALVAVLDPQGPDAPSRLQSFIVSGHKADFGIMVMDPDPLKVDSVHQALLASPLGSTLEATYSFVSLTEISEYVPSVEQYADRLRSGGEDANTPMFAAKVAAYEKRLPAMNEHRIAPEFPTWPAICFYPMNKSRVVGANWFTVPFSQRHSMMAEHAQSGMTFAGRVTQVVTVAVGLDDWEWGVTLWARNPQYLKEIVYRMRFDEASAKYGEFGPFYVGYVKTAAEIVAHCRL
jgi:hydrogen peroxide-dependent heme synthase